MVFHTTALCCPSRSNSRLTDSGNLQAQTLEQRRRNAKFAKEQEARMGKSEEQLKKRTKEVAKSPISPFWLGRLRPKLSPTQVNHPCLPLYEADIPAVSEEGRKGNPQTLVLAFHVALG
jgi:hypothetical protein